MSFSVERLRGMQDILPPRSLLFDKIERVMRDCASFYGFSLIRTPILEFTELFDRSVGDSSDIVQKEMYTFNDKSGRSVTMRPEFTAGVLRAVVDNCSDCAIFPLKLMYYGPCYRYEKPQVGRFREFYQFGVEIFGGNSHLADVEIISLAHEILKKLGIQNFSLEINCIGCSKCKGNYLNHVRDFFQNNYDSICETCKKRLKLNPLRIFDCKNDLCKNLAKNAPSTLDFVCDSCLNNFNDLKRSLLNVGISPIVNTRIVRGLDYYTKLVFEFVVEIDGASLTVCGGGRYDDLSKDLGGPELSATGLAIGVERVVKLLQDQNGEEKSFCCNPRDVYICFIDNPSRDFAVEFAHELRLSGVTADYDVVGRTLKSQLRYADKMKYKFTSVVGPNELKNSSFALKRMSDGFSQEFDISDLYKIVEYIKA